MPEVLLLVLLWPGQRRELHPLLVMLLFNPRSSMDPSVTLGETDLFLFSLILPCFLLSFSFYFFFHLDCLLDLTQQQQHGRGEQGDLHEAPGRGPGHPALGGPTGAGVGVGRSRGSQQPQPSCGCERRWLYKRGPTGRTATCEKLHAGLSLLIEN